MDQHHLFVMLPWLHKGGYPSSAISWSRAPSAPSTCQLLLYGAFGRYVHPYTYCSHVLRIIHRGRISLFRLQTFADLLLSSENNTLLTACFSVITD